MGIRIGKADFSKHEFALLILCLLFFGMLFFGSFKFQIMGKVFPLLVGGPGFVMVCLYLLSGYISPQLHEAMKRGSDFRLFGFMPDEETLPGHQQDSDGEKQAAFNINASYLVLILFGGYVVVSYLFGFYVSTFFFAGSYFFTFSKRDSHIGALSFPVKAALVLLLLGAVYVFDFSFGHNFMEGAVYEYLGLM